MIDIFNAKILQFFEIGEDFDKKMNLSIKKIIASFVEGLCISRSVQFREVALSLNKKAKDESTQKSVFLPNSALDTNFKILIYNK